ncbi:MAG: NAD-dependent epimerase/dehydratase family protein [Bradymonadaceae bacterium]
MSTADRFEHVLVTGGAGFIGAELVPELLDRGHRVTVLDLFAFGREPLAPVAEHPQLELVEGDIRDREAVDRTITDDVDAVIHLAAISNDPSSKLDAELTTSVNRDGVQQVMEIAADRVDRLIYASSASVYGIKEREEVTEDLELEPITLYADYKAEGERALADLTGPDVCGTAVRAATVCGYSPRLRLDLVVNILTAHALSEGRIRVFGGEQMRPNVHIRDIVDFYVRLLGADRRVIQEEAFNVSRANHTVMGLAELIRDELDRDVEITVEPSDDDRSYHLSAEKARRQLGFEPNRSIRRAVRDLETAWEEGRFETHDAPIHHNVDWMREHPADWDWDGRRYLRSE